MKKLLALLLSVWMLLCAMPAFSFAEDATVRVELTTDKIGLIFRNDEQPVIEFALHNDGTAALDATVTATVKDYDGNVVTEESAAVTVDAGTSAPFAPELGKVEKFGTYELYLTVTADGTTLFSEIYSFSRVLMGESTLDMFGASTHVMRSNSPYQDVFPLMKAAGLAYFRDDFDWSIMEREKGVRKIAETWRGGVDYALELELKPLMILTYGNDHYGATNPLKTEWLEGYVEYCRTLVTEFKGQAGAYQLWNEWNIGLAGSVPDQYEGPEYYAMTAFAAAKAIREIDPDTPIVLGSIAGVDINWMDYVLNYVDPITEEPLYDLIDAVSLQPYLYPNDPDSGDLYNTLKTVNDLMIGRERKEVWITEIGWPTGGADAVPEATAAANLVRMSTNFMSYDNLIDHVTWYQFHDYYQGDGSRESYFGLLRYPESSRAVPYHAKPAYLTLSAMNAKLGDAEYVDDPELGDGIIAHRFRKDDGGEVVVAWCRNTNKILTLTTDQGVTVSDMYGNVLTEGTGAVSMTLSDHPIYIEMADASKL